MDCNGFCPFCFFFWLKKAISFIKHKFKKEV